MVALAAGSSSRSTEISYQTKITTVMLVRDGVIFDSDLSSSPKNEDQQGLLGTQIGKRGS
jgi:hypothetical protein